MTDGVRWFVGEREGGWAGHTVAVGQEQGVGDRSHRGLRELPKRTGVGEEGGRGSESSVWCGVCFYCDLRNGGGMGSLTDEGGGEGVYFDTHKFANPVKH